MHEGVEAREAKPFPQPPPSGRGRGFTLIEVIVIVIIIGVLATLIVPRIFSRVAESRQATAVANAATLANAVKTFALDHYMPASGAPIGILWEKPADVEATKWQPYVDNAEKLNDPWGRPFMLVIPGQKNYDFDIVSYGRDGQPGGTGEDEDIIKP